MVRPVLFFCPALHIEGQERGGVSTRSSLYIVNEILFTSFFLIGKSFNQRAITADAMLVVTVGSISAAKSIVSQVTSSNII